MYDVTNYLEDHPGGSALLLEVAGKDATEEFVEAGHSEEANEALEALCVGHLPEDVRAFQHPGRFLAEIRKLTAYLDTGAR